MFANVRPMIGDVMKGYEATVFAYGQTGTGKTHTMEGDLSSEAQKGIIPRAVDAIFDDLKDDKYLESTVTASYLEIYNEDLTDLLTADEPLAGATAGGFGHGKAKSGGTGLSLLEEERKRPTVLGKKAEVERSVVVKGLSEHAVANPSDVLGLIHRAQERRKVGETKMNKHSSRSHCVFTLTVATKRAITNDDGTDAGTMEACGKLHLVDLAGSECAKTAGKDSDGAARMAERKNINTSLLILGRVISALREGGKGQRIPYRDSKLTRLLQESLGGRCKTLIVATLSPSVLAIEETTSTLNYAQAAGGITNKPVATSYYKLPTLTAKSGDVAAAIGGMNAADGQDWHELTCRYAELKAQKQELEAVLMRKKSEQDELVQRARDAETARHEAVEALKKEEAESARLRDENEKTQRELATTNYVLSARRDTEAALSKQAGVVLHKLGAADAAAASLHTTLGDAAAKMSEQLGRRAAFCEAAAGGLAAATEQTAALGAMVGSQRGALADAAAASEAELAALAADLHAAAEELAAAAGAEARRGTDAAAAASKASAERLEAGCASVKRQAEQMATAATAAHERAAGALGELEAALKSSEATLGEWSKEGAARQAAAGAALEGEAAALDAAVKAAADAAAAELSAARGRLGAHDDDLKELLTKLASAQATEGDRKAALAELQATTTEGAAATAAATAAVATAVADASAAQQAAQRDAQALAAVEGALAAAKEARSDADATLGEQKATLDGAVAQQEAGNGADAAVDALKEAKGGVDEATTAAAATLESQQVALKGQQEALAALAAEQAAMRTTLLDEVLAAVRSQLTAQLDGLGAAVAKGVDGATADSQKAAATAKTTAQALQQAATAHAERSEAMATAATAWGASNAEVAAQMRDAVAAGGRVGARLGVGETAAEEAAALATTEVKAWAAADGACREALGKAGEMHSALGAQQAALFGAQAESHAALETLATALTTTLGDSEGALAAAKEHCGQTAADVDACAAKRAEESVELGAKVQALDGARAAAFAAEAAALGELEASRPAVVEAALAQRRAAEAASKEGADTVAAAAEAQAAGAAALIEEETAQFGAFAADAARLAADAEATYAEAGGRAAAKATGHKEAAAASAAARAELCASHAAAADAATAEHGAALGALAEQAAAFRAESDAVAPVDVPARVEQKFVEAFAATADELELRAHFEVKGDVPYVSTLQANAPPAGAPPAAAPAVEAEAAPPVAASPKPAAKASPLDKVRVHLELENLENLRVPELRAMLREAGHEAKGSKDELLVALKRMNSSASDSGVAKLKEAEKEPRRSPRRSAPAGSPRRSAPAKSMLPPGGSKLKAPRASVAALGALNNTN